MSSSRDLCSTPVSLTPGTGKSSWRSCARLDFLCPETRACWLWKPSPTRLFNELW